MLSVHIFGEDVGHEAFLKAIVGRMSKDRQLHLEIRDQSVRGGRGKVVTELKQYFRDLDRHCSRLPDLVIVATDANCQGFVERRKEIEQAIPNRFKSITICAIPDPHIERWMLLDSSAFRKVLGKGCAAPRYKCERDRYKRLLIQAVQNAGVTPQLGGNEYAEDIVYAMDFDFISDNSLRHFLDDLRRFLKNQPTK